jgi:site-specific recombinase XerD
MQKLTWSRFRVACVLMFFTGLRVSEVAYTPQEIINDLKQVGRCQFYQSKVNSMRTVFISTKAYKYLDLIEQDIIDVYSAKNPNPIPKSEFGDP